jgi:hypothetical protein
LTVGVATTAAVIACDYAENRRLLGALNAISHIAWEDDALHQDELSAKYTGVALGMNLTAHAGWALIYEAFFGTSRGAKSLAGGALVATLAYIVDYKVVPPRFTPGFEHRLSCRSLLFIYVALAVALATKADDK